MKITGWIRPATHQPNWERSLLSTLPMRFYSRSLSQRAIDW